MMMKRCNVFGTLVALGLFLSPHLRGEVKLANLFTDNMVLQREMPAPVWGTAEPGEEVTVEFAGQKMSARADEKGLWKVTLSPLEVSPDGRNLEVSSGESRLRLSGILVGDVWLCAGQSNMAYQLKKDIQADTEIPRAAHPEIRFLLTAWQTSDTPLTSVKSPIRNADPAWAQASPETVGNLSAVGYWFAREINKATGVPIGLLTAYKGGSPVEAWLPKEALLASDGGAETWARYEAACEVFPEKYAVYQEEMKVWREKVKGLSLEERKQFEHPRAPYGPIEGNHPCGLFYGSIHPYIPLVIKGVLWYQAESNACSPMRKAKNYESTFTNLIRSWRGAWDRPDLPFLFVQLPGFRAVSPEPEDSVWSRVRDAQTRSLALPHTGMAVTIDVGNEKDIHPKNKQPVGERLAQWAKASVYGMDVVPSGPLYDQMEVRVNQAVITYKHAGQGLVSRDVTLTGGHQLRKEELSGFTICGDDKQFVRAVAEITASNQVTVSSPEVASPVAVR
jgi:sialate O-acetylesterase